MVRRRALLNLGLAPIVSVVIATPYAAYAASGCDLQADRSGSCGSVGGGGVQVGGWERFNGGDSGTPSRQSGGRGSGRGGSKEPPGRGTPDWCAAGICGWAPATPAAADPGEPGVTLEDVASFAPTVPKGAMEPGPGIAVRKLPANFISHAEEEVVSAPLLGREAEVLFTPVRYAWETGDGGRIESTTPGKTWKQLRAKELTDTGTSHRYRERGYYDVRPIVTFDTSYRFDGSGWIPVGELEVPGESMPVRVVTVETRLTRGTCIEYPNDPGCR